MAYFIYPDYGCGRILRNVRTFLPNNVGSCPKYYVLIGGFFKESNVNSACAKGAFRAGYIKLPMEVMGK
jgi:hypothetical protein